MPEETKYELATIKDIFDKVPTDRIRTCMDELAVLLSQAAGTRDLFMAVAENAGLDPSGVIPKLPEFFTWIDDGKGDLSLRVMTKEPESGERAHVFSIDTHVPPK